MHTMQLAFEPGLSVSVWRVLKIWKIGVQRLSSALLWTEI